MSARVDTPGIGFAERSGMTERCWPGYARPTPRRGQSVPGLRWRQRMIRVPSWRHGVAVDITLLESRATLIRFRPIAVMAAKSLARPHQPLSSRTAMSLDIEPRSDGGCLEGSGRR
jgi:hypothetical protein